MTQRVPEFALVLGLFFGVTLFVAGAVLTDDLLTTFLVAVLVAYPFVGFAAVRSADPTTVLVPGPTLAVGVGLGVAAAVGGALSGPLPASAFLGLALGLAVSLPAVAYAVHVDPPAPPVAPRTVVAASVGTGVIVMVAAVPAGAVPLGAVDGGLIALSGSLYGHRVGLRLAPRWRPRVLGAGALAALVVTAVGLFRAGGPGEWVFVAVAALLVPALFVALTDGR